MRLDFLNLNKMIDEKYISVQKHPKLDYFIYNYTQRAQFDRIWNNETTQCRGLIMDKNNTIIARPFPKFFNLSEYLEKGGQLPAEDFVVTEKLDGSLGIMYFDLNDNPALATRGSFVSEQALHGTKILNNKYLELQWNPAYTYLFEIIYPMNRIVVDYGSTDDLILLAVIDTYTGEEFPYKKLLEWFNGKLPIVQKYDAIKDFTKIEIRPNAEGYVIFFPSTHQRFKVKFDEYVRLHRLITGVNAKTIWELLKNSQDFSELMEKVPDEFFYWVKTTKQTLEDKYAEIDFRVHQDMLNAEGLLQHVMDQKKVNKKNPKTRKNFAQIALRSQYPQILFALYDHKPYQEMIWKLIKPKAEKPFKEEI